MYKKHLYPANWFDTIRPAILKRADYKCESCKLPHRSRGYYDYRGIFVSCDEHMCNWAARNGIKTHIVYLHIAHIDQNRNNNDYSNLKALCPQCHRNLDKKFSDILRRASRKR